MTAEPNVPRPTTPLRDLSVAELVARARGGSRAAYGELVARYEDRLFNFLLRRAGNAADAEDLAQETFVRAWQHIDRYDARWQFSTWLFTIGARLAISRLRRERGRRTMTLDEAGPPDPGAAPDPTRAAADRELFDQLWDVADRVLSETQRSALWLRYAEDLPPRTIARILGKSPIGVRVMLFRARETLAEHWDERRAEHCAEPAPPRPRSATSSVGVRRRDAAPALPNPVAGGAT